MPVTAAEIGAISAALNYDYDKFRYKANCYPPDVTAVAPRATT
jgi:hypothetical protein